MTEAIHWNPILIENPDLASIHRSVPDHRRMILTVLDYLLERSERDPDYPFIDSKFSTLSGEDFGPGPLGETRYKSRETVYGWIQGRALEALVGHARWLESCDELPEEERQGFIERIRPVVERLASVLETIRHRNDGRLFFTFLPNGTPVRFTRDGEPYACAIPPESNFSELFVAKGLMAAAPYLQRPEWSESGRALLLRICRDIETGDFVGDQIPFPPVDRESPSSLYWHAPWMIALGAHALAYETSGDPEWLSRGIYYLDRILQRHLNDGRYPELQPLDFFETLGADNRPAQEQGSVISAIGHVIEVVGLGSKVLLHLQNSPQLAADHAAELERYRDLLPRILLHHFELGYNAHGQGLSLSVDLLSRRPVKSEMPWWIPPELLRAAAALLCLSPKHPLQPRLLEAIRLCSNAFLHRFVNPHVHLFAYQTRNADGEPIDWIPATPDADPGYHTGLCEIDFIRSLQAVPIGKE
ncbi:hypothetical protein JW992_06150 [candidate division KSB1 bacterium]|nr:hypothetical protein [candidate division KSB1 bacterium]